MKPWLVSISLAFLVAVVIAFLVRDDWGFVPYISAIYLASYILSLFIAWLAGRIIRRKSRLITVFIIILATYVFSTISMKPLFGDWFWKISPWIAVFPIVFCGIPLVAFLILFKKERG